MKRSPFSLLKTEKQKKKSKQARTCHGSRVATIHFHLPRATVMHYQASSMLILQLLLISSTIWKSRGMPIARSLSSFSGVGVTSILPVPNTRLLSDDDIGNPDKSDRDNLLSFYVGTKRGLMKKITMNTKRAAHNDDDVHIQFIEEEETDGSKHKTPYPIFSMMVCR